MENHDVVILGGGIAGLIAANVLKEFKPLLIEAAQVPGGNFGAGLAYLRATTSTIQLVRELRVPYHVREVRGAMETLAKQVVTYPQWLWDQPQSVREIHQAIHWIKTRGSVQTFQASCMNDPCQERGGGMRNRWEQAIHLDREKLIKALVRGLDNKPLCGAPVIRIRPDRVELADGRTFGWANLVLTIPLWVIRALMKGWHPIPKPIVNRLAVLTAECDFETEAGGRARPTAVGRALLDGHDYVYTPFHPTMNRVSPVQPLVSWGGPIGAALPWAGPVAVMTLVAEFNWDSRDPAGTGYMARLREVVGASGVSCRDVRVIPGHLIPLSGSTTFWPDRIHRLGRFAEWDSRATADVVLGRAFGLREKFRTWRTRK